MTLWQTLGLGLRWARGGGDHSPSHRRSGREKCQSLCCEVVIFCEWFGNSYIFPSQEIIIFLGHMLLHYCVTKMSHPVRFLRGCPCVCCAGVSGDIPRTGSQGTATAASMSPLLQRERGCVRSNVKAVVTHNICIAFTSFLPLLNSMMPRIS